MQLIPKFILTGCVLLFSSCLKEFTCECTTTTTTFGMTEISTDSERIIRTKKEDAVIACEMRNTIIYDDTATQISVIYQRDCKIK